MYSELTQANATYYLLPDKIVWFDLRQTIPVFLIILLICAALAFDLHRRISKEIVQPLTNLNTAVASGDPNNWQPPEPSGPNEVIKLGDAIGSSYKKAARANERSTRSVEVLNSVLSQYGLSIRHFEKFGEYTDYGPISSVAIASVVPDEHMATP